MEPEQNDSDLPDKIVEMIMAEKRRPLVRAFQYAKLHAEVNTLQEQILEAIGYNNDRTVRGKFMISVIMFDDHEAPNLPPITVVTTHESIDGTKWEKMSDVYFKSLTVSHAIAEQISEHPDDPISIAIEIMRPNNDPDSTSANLPGYN